MNKLAIMFFLALLLVPASAELLVGISPKDNSSSTIYPSEASEFVVSVLNASAATVENVSVRISAGEGLMLKKNDSVSRQAVETIEQIRPSEKARVFFTVLAGEKPREKGTITVDYGFGNEFLGTASKEIVIADGPLRLEARALRSTITVGGKASIAVTARNIGKTRLENVLIELVLPAGILPLTPPIIIPAMNPGDALVEKGFGFEFDPAVRGRKTITVRASFLENDAPRFVEKRIDIDTQDKDLLVGGIMLATIALILLALFMRKEKKPGEKKVPPKSVEEHH